MGFAFTKPICGYIVLNAVIRKLYVLLLIHDPLSLSIVLPFSFLKI